jgi:phage terminase small subunit
MINKRSPAAPSYLTAAAKRWWKSVLANYALEDHHLHLLRLACEALDRAEEARAALATLGTTYLDRFNAPHPRPEVAIERDSRIAYARLCRELDLDTEMPASSRPPALRSNRRG